MKTKILLGVVMAGVGTLLTLPAAIAQQILPGHVPEAVSRLRLQPTDRLPGTNQLALAIGLPLRNQETLTNLLQRLYDPASPDYHHYLTPAQFAEAFGPTKEAYQAVTAFAIAHGLKVIATHSNRVLLDVAGSVSEIESAFHVHLRTYAHPREKRVFYAPDAEPSLELVTPVLHISGLDNYRLPQPMNLKKRPPAGVTGAVPATGSGPSGAYLGNDFRAAYVPGLALTGTGQSVGLLEFDSGYYQSDITNYEALAGLPNVPVKAELLDGYDGGPGNGNDEVSLDIEMAISMAPGLASVIVYEGSTTDDILNQMATDNLAKQLSASWTYGIDAESDQIFLQFAAQGQSFFNASGDGDAYVDAGNYDPPAPPTDDPNLTCVGGTTLTTSGPGGAWVSETVWNWGVEHGSLNDGIGGSGGISINNPIPSWQVCACQNTSASQASTTFRNLPDVALTADNVFVVYGGGQTGSFGGTSCATPLWAAFTALANEQAVAGGHPTLGFLNPAIYAIGCGANYASCFHDITTGSNTWSESLTDFQAVPGYDLCTGWGTPTGTNLINLLAPPDALQVSPLGGWTSSGRVGGPLAPASQTYVLTNVGNAAINWAAAATGPWLNLSLHGGTLTPGGAAAAIVVSLNAASSNLFLGTYAATLWFTNLTDGAVQSRPFALTVIKPPVITVQPAGLAAIGETTATFTAGVAGGLPLFCQWRYNGTNLTSGGRIANAQSTLTGAGNIYGATACTLTISNVTAADGGNYSLVASNAAGTTVSSNAVLTITPSGPVIVQQPASQTVPVGATVQLAVVADGNAPFSYQWKINQTNLTDGGSVSGVATPTLTINGASSASIGTYSVVVSNGIGNATSTGAVLSVVAMVPGEQLVQNGGFETGDFTAWGGSGNFADCTVTIGSTAVHSGNYGALLGPAGSLGYLSQSLPTVAGQVYLLSLWLDSPDGVSPNEFMVGWNGTPVFDQTNLEAMGWTNLQFYVMATGTNTDLQFGSRDDESFLGLDDITLTPVVTADGPPIIVTQPANRGALLGGTATFTVLSSGRLPLSYQWQFSATNLANATNATLTVSNLTVNQAGSYDVVVTNALGSATSSNALLTALTVLVQNGGFELGSFADWTTGGNFLGCYITTLNPYVHSGVYGAELGPTGSPGYLSQTIPTTVGQSYVVSCWLYSDGSTPNEFSVSWNGAMLFDQRDIGATLWTNLEFQASATTANTVLTFGFRDDPLFLGLDDITVYPTPQLGPVTWNNGAVNFSWSAQSSQLYQVQYTTNLTLNSWVNLGGVLSTTGSSITATDTAPVSTVRFYRLVLVP